MTPVSVHDEPFERVSGEWAGLLAQDPHAIPFTSPTWQRVWLRHFQADRQARILTAREGERLVGVAPFIYDGSRAEFVGHYSICDYMDVVVAPGFEASFFGPVLERLAADGIGELDLRGLRESSPTLSALTEAAPAAGFSVERHEEARSPGVSLPASWDEYLGTLSKKDRHELRRKMRRLESLGGDVEFRAVTSGDEAGELLDVLFSLMRQSSHHKEEFLQRPGIEPFFREIAPAMAGERMLRFYVLRFDGQPVASVLNFDLNGGLYMYNSGYDPAYSRYAVGLMSKAMLVRDAIEQGRSCVDFLRGDESYKYDLGGKDQVVYRLVLKKT